MGNTSGKAGRTTRGRAAGQAVDLLTPSMGKAGATKAVNAQMKDGGPQGRGGSRGRRTTSTRTRIMNAISRGQ